MAVIARLYVFEGDDRALAEQLGQSLNDGIRVLPGVQISVLTLPAGTLKVLGDISTALRDLSVNPESDVLLPGARAKQFIADVRAVGQEE